MGAKETWHDPVHLFPEVAHISRDHLFLGIIYPDSRMFQRYVISMRTSCLDRHLTRILVRIDVWCNDETELVAYRHLAVFRTNQLTVDLLFLIHIPIQRGYRLGSHAHLNLTDQIKRPRNA